MDEEKVNNTDNTMQQETVQEGNSNNVVNKPKKDKKGFCIASMVLGIIALIFFCIWYIAIPCAILAIIFGIVGCKSTGKGMAIAGLVTGSIAIVISILMLVLIAVGIVAGVSSELDKSKNLLDYESSIFDDDDDDYDYDYDYDSYDFN